jgi:hypothetical protein
MYWCGERLTVEALFFSTHAIVKSSFSAIHSSHLRKNEQIIGIHCLFLLALLAEQEKMI